MAYPPIQSINRCGDRQAGFCRHAAHRVIYHRAVALAAWPLMTFIFYENMRNQNMDNPC